MLARPPYNRPVLRAWILRNAMLRRAPALAFGFGILLSAGAAGAESGDATDTHRGSGFRSPVAGSRLAVGMSARVVWDRSPGLAERMRSISRSRSVKWMISSAWRSSPRSR